MLVLLTHGRKFSSEFWALVLPILTVGVLSLIQLTWNLEPLQSRSSIGDLRRTGPIFFWSLTAAVAAGTALNAKLASGTILSAHPPRVYWVGSAAIVAAFLILCLIPVDLDSSRSERFGPAIQFATFCPLAYLMALDLIQLIAARR